MKLSDCPLFPYCLVLFLAVLNGSVHATASSTGDPGSVRYSLIYIIHGDGNYLYHAQNGEAQQADKKVLKEATKVGRKAKRGEVFIFHQRPEKKILGIFPKKDRKLLYFRNGRLVSEQNYSPDHQSASDNPFAAETKLYNKYQSSDQNYRVLSYFGHEIPDKKRKGYHKSSPSTVFGEKIFVSGIKTLSDNKNPFKLVVLSTCDDGTPRMANLLKDATQTLLASPQNLHLSHIDTKSLLLLEKNSSLSSFKLADALAKQTFSRLSSSIQTVITLSVYQLEKVSDYLPQLADGYKSYAENYSEHIHNAENTDCGRLPFFVDSKYEQGVHLYFRPPRFGRHARWKSHSGWGCKNTDIDTNRK